MRSVVVSTPRSYSLSKSQGVPLKKMRYSVKDYRKVKHSPGTGPKQTKVQKAAAQRSVDEYTLYSVGDPNVYSDEIADVCAVILVILSWVVMVLTFPICLVFCLKIVKEYERAVMFRLGRLAEGGARGPGIFFILPCIDAYRKVDLRVVSFDVPPQEILSKDSVTVSVDAVVYFRINNPVISVTNVTDAFYSTKLLAQTTLRNILGTKNLSEMLSERETISHVMGTVLDEATEPWGVKVERVEVKDIRLPHQLMRAMAAEAEATREAKAKVIAAEGEQKASNALKEAADVMTESPAAIQLRYLQTLNSIATEHNQTVVFPLPIELFRTLFGMSNNGPGIMPGSPSLASNNSTNSCPYCSALPSQQGSAAQMFQTGGLSNVRFQPGSSPSLAPAPPGKGHRTASLPTTFSPVIEEITELMPYQTPSGLFDEIEKLPEKIESGVDDVERGETRAESSHHRSAKEGRRATGESRKMSAINETPVFEEK